jgi:hypothetical protein
VGRIVGDTPTAPNEHPGDIRLDFARVRSVAMDAIGTITVGSQAWRWTGRPLAPFPFSKALDLNGFPPNDPQDPNDPDPAKRVPPPSPSDHAFLWDIEGFAERLDETLDDETVAVPITEVIEKDTSGNPQSKPQPIRVALRAPARADTARYMRFKVTAENRYLAAYRAARANLAPLAAKWASASGAWVTPWYRVLRPAKQPDVVPKPGIRGLIPLTRAIHRIRCHLWSSSVPRLPAHPGGEWNDDDFDVLASGEVVGRIFQGPCSSGWLALDVDIGVRAP